ncbi:uncharacterized protein PITG_20993 [Phytophthora infestans T30-4]|uniref:Uncharacterized protein n=1 Tax=Phytophthora infestans (strain T30-4) TaxID=403677 RepID=D0P3G3_PHYIT|nr:uncharacterized protein PITG_20993 [Phytophthora infestans T30-4]EEY59747.1 conserved hypothetical protein [Phytophthora infestans T30-4]|eukprot:XP_002895161.1 conserved hypothetical protein [Phytophthora infestans T30-4]
MRGLKKRKSSEFTQRQATPISLDMLRALHSHLESAPGLTEASRLWFLANVTLGIVRPSTSDPEVSISYGSPLDVLTHLTTWLTYVETKTDHKWDDDDYIFPALSKISKSVIKTDAVYTCCENVRVEWGKEIGDISGSLLTHSAALAPSTYLCSRRLNDDGHFAW